MEILKKMEMEDTAAATLTGILADICGADTLEGAKVHAEAAIELLDDELRPSRLTAVQIDTSNEVTIEELLMMLALAGQMITVMEDYIRYLEANDGDPGNLQAPDQWAVSGASRGLAGVSHALKCACWGHERAFTH